jgi:Xaa-Pro aminopeptidase
MTLSPGLVRERRDSLVAELRKDLRPGESGVFYLLGAPPADLQEFRQSSDFLYLTGLESTGAGLILFFGADRMAEHLYLPRRDPSHEKWGGVVLGPGAIEAPTLKADVERQRAIDVTGFRGHGKGDPSSVGEMGSMRDELSGLLARSAVLFLDYQPPGLGQPDTAESKLAAEARERYPQIRIAPASPALARLRLVKSAEEIAAIRKAASITCEAHRAAMKVVKPGMMEYEVEAVLEYVFTRSGARYSAYPAIVGSGPNSCILHYFRNGRRIEDGDVVLIDAAAEFGRYAMDVTRTFPASGRFTSEQRRVYDAVLRAQTAAKALVRPGARISDIQQRAQKVLDDAGLGDRFTHGCCHFVGLDVHDVGDREGVLAPGMVLTVEPGAYLPEKGFGIRIEDTFLVTESGAENLSACMPSDPDEIEKEMARRSDLPSFGAAASPGGGR